MSGTGSQPYKRYRHSGSAGTLDLSIWLSVDPMSDKYPGVSPYTYCANNPVKLVDPNGREISDHIAPCPLPPVTCNLP